ncbi:hypothetical protein R50073_32270 [Maricurvus nonylphenolicus]|uniref:hypothetical protein n=1 Tax=Maricurvus nonylphenolicus TaxID=1008307 RepID=UPI0036F29043
MPYIERNHDGEIIALHLEANNRTTEYVSATDPAIVQFLSAEGDSETPKQILAESDRDIARVTEDLVHLLIAKNIILFTELPEPVQRKLLAREKLRSSLQGGIANFLDEQDTI